MSHPYIKIFKSDLKVGSKQGECVAWVDEDYAEKALELFQSTDQNSRFWAVPAVQKRRVA